MEMKDYQAATASGQPAYCVERAQCAMVNIVTPHEFKTLQILELLTS